MRELGQYHFDNIGTTLHVVSCRPYKPLGQDIACPLKTKNNNFIKIHLKLHTLSRLIRGLVAIYSHTRSACPKAQFSQNWFTSTCLLSVIQLLGTFISKNGYIKHRKKNEQRHISGPGAQHIPLVVGFLFIIQIALAMLLHHLLITDMLPGFLWVLFCVCKLKKLKSKTNRPKQNENNNVLYDVNWTATGGYSFEICRKMA